MAKQETYTKAYSPTYDAPVTIKDAYQSHHCDWLFVCVLKTKDDHWVHTTFAENELENFE